MKRPLSKMRFGLAEGVALPVWLEDVDVVEAPVPPALDGATARGVLWQAAPGRFVLEVPEVARYLVEAGRRIAVEPAPRANEREIRRFLRLTPLAALLFQRGALALHAAAVGVGGQGTGDGGPTPTAGAVLVAGDSGAGKSTLVAALLRRGWSVMADELAAVVLDEGGGPLVFPTFPEVRLWPDASARMGIAGGEDPGDISPRPPFPVLPCPPIFASPLPLRALYWLDVHPQAGVAVIPLDGAERFEAVVNLTYNPRIAAALLDRARCLAVGAAIARGVPVCRLLRPRGRWTVEELADRIERESA